MGFGNGRKIAQIMALDSLAGYGTVWYEGVRKLFKMMTSTLDRSKQIPAKSVAQNVRGPNKLSGPDLYFWSFVAVSCLVFWAPIRNLITFSLAHDYASHVLLIAPLSIFLIYLRRHEIFFSGDRKPFVTQQICQVGWKIVV